MILLGSFFDENYIVDFDTLFTKRIIFVFVFTFRFFLIISYWE